MKLIARCTLNLSAAADCPVVVMLRPRGGNAQWLISEHLELLPWVPSTEYIDSYGNLCQRLVVPQGQMRISTKVLMQTDAQIAVDYSAMRMSIDQLPDEVLLYLLQSRYCPSDKMAERAQYIVGFAQPGYAQVSSICNWIHHNLAYSYGVSSGSTDALDTLAQGAGVCRDFAHVGIALCRSLGIAARLVVGYLHDLQPMDLHAWFEAFIGGRWYTFDATQPNPRGGRIVLAYGRDAADVAFLSDYGPLPLILNEMQVSVQSQDENF
jgi:transglutaminase-like putative cysteine protease